MKNQLTSLEGAPQEVTGNFDCYDNQLPNLIGAPKKVGRSFNCDEDIAKKYGLQTSVTKVLHFNELRPSLDRRTEEIKNNTKQNLFRARDKMSQRSAGENDHPQEGVVNPKRPVETYDTKSVLLEKINRRKE